MKGTLAKLFGFQSNINENEQIKRIKVNQIQVNPFQPRKYFDESELRQLAESIKVHGVLQPIIVRGNEQGFELIAGERRLRASEIAGLNEIPAIVRQFDDRTSAELALIENIQRSQLNYLGEALAFSQLLNEFGLTQEELADRVGKSQSSIANKLRILKLPLEIRNSIDPRLITERHARALLKLNSSAQQEQVFREINSQGLTVKETEALIEQMQKNISREIKSSRPRIKGVIKDIRIFMNAIRSAVKTMNAAGVNSTIREEETEDHLEVTIKIAKHPR